VDMKTSIGDVCTSKDILEFFRASLGGKNLTGFFSMRILVLAGLEVGCVDIQQFTKQP